MSWFFGGKVCGFCLSMMFWRCCSWWWRGKGWTSLYVCGDHDDDHDHHDDDDDDDAGGGAKLKSKYYTCITILYMKLQAHFLSTIWTSPPHHPFCMHIYIYTVYIDNSIESYHIDSIFHHYKTTRAVCVFLRPGHISVRSCKLVPATQASSCRPNLPSRNPRTKAILLMEEILHQLIW